LTDKQPVLKTELWDMILCLWVCSSQRCEGPYCVLWVQGTTHPTTQLHIPEELSFLQHCIENMKSCN